MKGQDVFYVPTIAVDEVLAGESVVTNLFNHKQAPFHKEKLTAVVKLDDYIRHRELSLMALRGLDDTTCE